MKEPQPVSYLFIFKGWNFGSEIQNERKPGCKKEPVVFVDHHDNPPAVSPSQHCAGSRWTTQAVPSLPRHRQPWNSHHFPPGVLRIYRDLLFSPRREAPHRSRKQAGRWQVCKEITGARGDEGVPFGSPWLQTKKALMFFCSFFQLTHFRIWYHTKALNLHGRTDETLTKEPQESIWGRTITGQGIEHLDNPNRYLFYCVGRWWLILYWSQEKNCNEGCGFDFCAQDLCVWSCCI